MVLRPGGTHGCPRSLQDLVGPLSEHADCLTYYFLRVIEVDFPATSVCELGEHLAIHDAVGAALIRRVTLDSDVVGKSSGQARSEIETTGSGSTVAISSNAADVARATDARTFATSAIVAATSRRWPSRRLPSW